MQMIIAPDRTEAPEYFFTYIDKVGRGDIRHIIEAQLPEALALLQGISEEASMHRYAADKWSIRQVLGHINDTERVFTFRAYWFARGLGDELPGMDQNVAAGAAASDSRSWKSHVDEFRALREATIHLFQHLPDAAWSSRGLADGNSFTVRALAYCTAGHVTHHMKILRERYL